MPTSVLSADVDLLLMVMAHLVLTQGLFLSISWLVLPKYLCSGSKTLAVHGPLHAQRPETS